MFFQQSHDRDYTFFFLDRQSVPPDAKFVRELDVPTHNLIMLWSAY